MMRECEKRQAEYLIAKIGTSKETDLFHIDRLFNAN
jgi:hypothetical protein